MKRIHAITIQAPSRPGTLGEICRAMAESGVTLHAVVAPDAGLSGTLHLIPDNLESAKETLNQLTFPFSVEEAFQLTLPKGSDSFGDLLHVLSVARINIDFLFTLDLHNVIFATKELDRAESLIKENLST